MFEKSGNIDNLIFNSMLVTFSKNILSTFFSNLKTPFLFCKIIYLHEFLEIKPHHHSGSSDQNFLVTPVCQASSCPRTSAFYSIILKYISCSELYGSIPHFIPAFLAVFIFLHNTYHHLTYYTPF